MRWSLLGFGSALTDRKCTDGFNGTTEVKQADVVLLTYPLEYVQSAEQARVDLDFHAGVTSANGPGMTYSIFSIDTAQLSGDLDCSAYTYMLAASQPYNRAPYYQFSEQTRDEYSENGESRRYSKQTKVETR